MNRRDDKVIEIEKYLNDLRDFLPLDFGEYMADKKTRAACERCCEKIVEAVIDLVFIVIKNREFRSPQSNSDALDVLSENNIISLKLSDKLSDAKSMRNWLAHRYGDVNDRLVFDSLKRELIDDVKKFLEAVR